ncbi:hypothetical protein Leryth_015308 [Lithospermum erythrorhizon]|nr:hypothetical protein Leryth_015308 [Lithospermum erythrorhizon]
MMLAVLRIMKLKNFPKFNSVIDSRHPKFEIGMLFSSREELKAAIDTFNIKDARDIKYVRNEKSVVKGDCKIKVKVVYDNKTLTSTWLAKHYRINLKLNPKEMAQAKQHVSRWQAFRAKEAALKAIYGDECKQFERL